MTRQIGVGDNTDIERLMDMASEPYESNIYMTRNFTELTANIAGRLGNVLCNSKHFTAILLCYAIDNGDVPGWRDSLVVSVLD